MAKNGIVPFKKQEGTVPHVSICYTGWTTIFNPDGPHGGQCAIFAPSIETLRVFWKRMTNLPMHKRQCQRVVFFSERSLQKQQVGKDGGR